MLMIQDPSPTTVIGGGTGQSTTDPYACDQATWMQLFAVDYDNNGFDYNDYVHWFYVTFGDEAAELWQTVNGSTIPADPFNPIILPDPTDIIPDPTEAVIATMDVLEP